MPLLYKDNGALKEEGVQANTVMGVRNGLFANGASFSGTTSPETAIDTLKFKVKKFYGVK